MSRRISLSDVEQQLYRKRLVLDDYVLSIPKDKAFINWFVTEDCVDRDIYVEAFYYCNVELSREVADWCDETLNGHPTFAASRFLMTEDILRLSAPYSTACDDCTLELHFLSEAEAMLFKLRWF
jgi:hypothetical protein